MSQKVTCVMSHPDFPNFYIRAPYVEGDGYTIIKNSINTSKDGIHIEIDYFMFDKLINCFNLFDYEMDRFFENECKNLGKDFESLSKKEYIEFKNKFMEESIIKNPDKKLEAILTIYFNEEIYIFTCDLEK